MNSWKTRMFDAAASAMRLIGRGIYELADRLPPHGTGRHVVVGPDGRPLTEPLPLDEAERAAAGAGVECSVVAAP